MKCYASKQQKHSLFCAKERIVIGYRVSPEIQRFSFLAPEKSLWGLHNSPICPMWAMLSVQPWIVCPTHTFCIFQCCPRNPAAWTYSSLGRTILNNGSIKAAAKDRIAGERAGRRGRRIKHAAISSSAGSFPLNAWPCGCSSV